MAGKSNTSATFFAQKKLLGKAHTSNLKTDGEELIGSNIQAPASQIFGQSIPESPAQTLYLLQSASNGAPATVEYIHFALEALTGTTYDANETSPDGGAGSDSGESSQSSGTHTYKFKFKSDYESNSSNTKKGNGLFSNNKILHETLGKVQLVPPFFSQTAPNPYIVKIYKDNGSGDIGDEIPLLDNVDWNVDFYNGILFLQDFNSGKIPAHAKAYAYVGDFSDQGFFENSLSGSLQKLTDGSSYLIAGDNITISSSSNGQITISSTASSTGGSGGAKSKKSYQVTNAIASGSSLTTSNSDYTDAGHDPSLIDVFLNGQLLLSGTNAQVGAGSVDYFVSDSNKLKFGFDLTTDDIVNVIVASTGSDEAGNPGGSDTQVQFNDGGTLSGDSGLVFNKTSNTLTTNNLSGSLTKLSDGTSYIIANNNITITSQSNGSVLISAPNNIFNEYIGEANGSNTRFTLDKTPTANKNISVFVNGQLQLPSTNITGAPFQDYSVTGSVIFFVTASLPPQGSLLLANYTTNQSIS
jgi:hypothetical protein